LNQTDNLTFEVAVAKIMDYAQSENLVDLTKGGGKHAKHNTFTVQDGAYQTDECRGWKRGNCKFGDFCKFKHTGEGGCAPKDRQYVKGQYPGRKRSTPLTLSTPQPTAASTSATSFSVRDHNKAKTMCSYCNSDGHQMRGCPHVKMENEAGTADVHMVSADKAVDYVFVTHYNRHDGNVHPPDANVVPMSAYQKATAVVTMVFCMLLLAPTGLAKSSARLAEQCTRSPCRVVALLVILAALSYTALARPTLPGEFANIKASSFVSNSDAIQPSLDHEWCSDSGTNRFVTNDINDFVSGTVSTVPTIVAVGGGNVTSPCYGTVIVESLDHGCTMQCMDVLYIPECGKKLMPASPFIRKGCSLILDDYDKVNLSSKDGTPILSGCELGGLYYFRCKTLRKETPEANPSASSPASGSYFGLPMGKNIGAAAQDFSRRLLESHWAYGHLHFDKLRKLLGLKKGDDPECPACTIAKSRTTALSKQTYDRSTRVNHRMHMDLGFTRNSEYCFQLYIDDYTRESYLDLLENKDKVLPDWQTLKNHLENKHAPWKFAFIRTDGEPIYSTDHWGDHCKAEGLEHEFSSRYRHDQLGVAERGMQSIGVAFRCMMIQGCAPESDIPDCLLHANVIRNNSPTKANNGRTPREKAAGMKLPPNKRLLRGPLFCLVFAHVYEEERVKHAPRGIACVYLGYDDVNNSYKVKEWVSGKKYYTADLTFHPNTFPYRVNPNRTPGWLSQFEDLAPHVIEGKHDDTLLGPRRSRRQHDYQYSAGQALGDVPDVDLPPDAVNTVNFDNYMVHSFGPEPTTWEEAINSKYANEWIMAELAEKESFAHHGVYDLVPRSAAVGRKIFKPRPVLKIKVNPPTDEHPHGSIDKFKYRLTIAAFTKMLTQGIDYVEKYASTVRWNSVKMLIAIAVWHDYDLVLFDITAFFLYGKLTDKEKVFMEQPLGWETEGKPREDYVCQLNRSMYGLPQAPHCAQRELKATLTASDQFKPTTADDCVYVSQDEDKYSALGAHVDDLLGIGDSAGLQKITDTLTRNFKITEQRNPTIVTGVQIQRNRKQRWLKLHQGAYIANLLTDYNMTDCNSTDTPMDPGTARALMLLPASTEDLVALKQYQRLVGSLIWLLKTRPDMMFTVNLLCRFLKSATRQHYDLARGRPLRYLKGTVTHGLVFQPGTAKWDLSGASDSDLAGDLNSARSTTGFFAKMGEYGAVVCSSTLEKKVSTSTGQAETYAMQSLTKEVVWDRHLLRELRHEQEARTLLLTDNDGVLKQSTKAINHSTAKHYRIAQAYIRSKVDDNTIEVGPIDTSLNAADMFTKALPATSFLRHRATIMGPQEPSV
jgi:hypothetical protein